METIMDYLYTGHIDQSAVDKDYEAIYAAAIEYQLDGVADITRECYERNMECANVRETLDVARSYCDATLIEICFEFILANYEAVSMEPSFSSLATEDSELWDDIHDRLDSRDSDADPSAKRQRTEAGPE
jgi:hypothetical protein